MEKLLASYIDWFILAIIIGFGFELGGSLYHVLTDFIHRK